MHRTQPTQTVLCFLIGPKILYGLAVLALLVWSQHAEDAYALETENQGESLNQENDNMRFHLKNGIEFQKLSQGPRELGEV